MPTINQLSAVDQINDGDQFPLYSPNAGDARKASFTTVKESLADDFASLADLAAQTGAGLVGTSNGTTVQQALDSKPTATLDTDDTLAANSDGRVASQKATKTYVDAYKSAVAASSGSSLIGHIAAGTGAVVRTAQSKLREAAFSVKDFGALGDNSNDDTAEIQAAVDALVAAGGGVLQFPRGIYKISSAISVTAPITFRGEGPAESVIRQSNATAGGINFDFASLVQGGGVEDISVEAGTGWISGGSQGSGSTGIGIAVRNSNGKFYAKNFGVHNFDTGVRIRGCFYSFWTEFEVLFATTDGILIDTSDGTSGGTIGAGNWFNHAKVSNFGFTGTNTGSTGIRALAGGGDFFASIDVTTFNKGWQIAPSAGKQVLYGFFTSCLGDSCLSHNWEFDGTLGNVWSMGLEGCWGAFSTNGDGLRILGANTNSIRWNGGRLRENGRHGVSIEGGVNVAIDGVEIASNSKLGAGVSHGVSVAANASQWSVRECRIGNYASGLNTQQNGINVAAGTSENFTIVANDLRGNLNQAISLGTSSLLFTIGGNLPLQTPGLNRSFAQSMSSSTPSTVAAASTVYLGPNGLANTNIFDSVWLANKIGVVREAYTAVVAAPGTGETFTYTLFKNGVATSMTWQIAGNASFAASTTGNPVAVAPGDALEIRLVTSASATATKHRYYISVE